MPPFVIPPLVVWALGTVGAAVLARFVRSEWQRVNAELHARDAKASAESIDRNKIPTLKRDPVTGIYRVD
jgi:hypothetical protein